MSPGPDRQHSLFSLICNHDSDFKIVFTLDCLQSMKLGRAHMWVDDKDTGNSRMHVIWQYRESILGGKSFKQVWGKRDGERRILR